MPANFTKHAIMEAFLSLASKKALQKITVKDIVDECGINRNTFYYHFQDIYALVDELFLAHAETAIKDVADGMSWTEAFIARAEEMAERPRVYAGICRSIDKERLDDYFCTVAERIIPRIIHGAAPALRITDADMARIIAFYSYAVGGLWADWVGNGMRETARDFIEGSTRLFSDGFRSAVLNAAKGAESVAQK